MTQIHTVDVSGIDPHWFEFGVRCFYILSYEYYPLLNEWVVIDNQGRAHTVPKHTLLGDSLPTWLFGLWLRTDYPKYTQSLDQYATVEDEMKALNHELDIYRGVVPTPKNYKANPERVKQLMQRYAELNKGAL